MIDHENCVILLRFHAIQTNSKLFTTPTPNFWHAGMDYYSNATSRLWIKTIPFYMQYLGPAKKGHIWEMTSSSKKKRVKRTQVSQAKGVLWSLVSQCTNEMTNTVVG